MKRKIILGADEEIDRACLTLSLYDEGFLINVYNINIDFFMKVFNKNQSSSIMKGLIKHFDSIESYIDALYYVINFDFNKNKNIAEISDVSSEDGSRFINMLSQKKYDYEYNNLLTLPVDSMSEECKTKYNEIVTRIFEKDAFIILIERIYRISNYYKLNEDFKKRLEDSLILYLENFIKEARIQKTNIFNHLVTSLFYYSGIYRIMGLENVVRNALNHYVIYEGNNKIRTLAKIILYEEI